MSKNDWNISIPPSEVRQAKAAFRQHGLDFDIALSRIVERSARRVEGLAKQKVPVKFGELRRSIDVERVGPLSMTVVVNKEYGSAVEFGTRPHDITPKRKKALAFKPGGGFRFWDESGRIVVRKVRHPGTKGKPFLRPAMEEEAPVLANTIRMAIEDPKKYAT